MRRRFGGDHGAATTEFVIVIPLLIISIVLVVQVGLYFHAAAVASAAAQEGARTATMQGGTIEAGQREAEDFVDAVAPRLIPDDEATGQLTDNGEAIRMTVTGNVLPVYVFPGFSLDLSVNETAESIIEEFRPSTEAPPTDSTP